MTEQEIKAYNAGYDDAVKDFSMWHPASELPPVDGNGTSDLVYALGKVFSKEFGEYIDKVTNVMLKGGQDD